MGSVLMVHPIRVLIACDRLGSEKVKIHGVGRLMVEWATGFDPDRVEVTACTLRKGGTAGEAFVREGVPLTFFGHGRLNPLSIVQLVRLIRARKIDVLHLQDFGAGMLGRIAGLLTGTPAVLQVHARYDENSSGYPFLVQFMDRLLAPLTTCALAVSEPVAAFCVEKMGFRREQVTVVPNPVPRYGFAPPSEAEIAALRARYGISPETPVVGTTSRVERLKGLHVLIEAFAKVLQSVPEARLLIVGDGPDRAAFEASAQALGLGDRVIFTGFRRAVNAHLRLFSVTAVPSIWAEPFPLSALESLGAGVPVVGTRVGGLSDIVGDGMGGLLVPPNDAAALAGALVRVLNDATLREQLSRGGRLRSEKFSMQHHTARMEEIYRRAAGTIGG